MNPMLYEWFLANRKYAHFAKDRPDTLCIVRTLVQAKAVTGVAGMVAGVQFLGLQRSSEGDQVYIVIPTERMGLNQAQILCRRVLTHRSSDHKCGVTRITNARYDDSCLFLVKRGFMCPRSRKYSDTPLRSSSLCICLPSMPVGYSMHYAAVRELCAIVCTSELETTPLSITRLLEAVMIIG